MKQKYSYLVIAIISMFSVGSASLEETFGDKGIQESFTFIMQSLKASHYREALQGNNSGRLGIQKFGEGHLIFKMTDKEGNTMLHAVLQASQDTQIEGNKSLCLQRNDVIDEMLKRCPDLLSAENLKKVLPANDASQTKEDPVKKNMAHSLLKYAAKEDFVEIAKHAIGKCGASVESTVEEADWTTSTMLDWAIMNKSKKVAQYLLSKGAPLTEKGLTTLHKAIISFDDGDDIIDAILARKPDLLNVQDGIGRTPFILAVNKDKRKAMEHLLDKPGLDLTLKGQREQGNALAWAIFNNRPVDFIKRILDKEAKLLDEYSGEGQNKKSLLHEALGMDIQENESSDDEQKNRIEIIKELIKRKPDLLKEKDGEGRTPLEYAKELKSKGKIIDEILITTLQTVEKELPPQSLTEPQSLEAALTPDNTNASWYHNKAIIGLIGIPVILGIAYRIKKMLDAKSKPVSEYVEKQTTKAAHDD